MSRLTHLAVTALLANASSVAGFVSTSAASRPRPSPVLKAATGFRGDTSIDIDYDRARECAESFGECSIEDMERMKNCEWKTVHSVSTYFVEPELQIEHEKDGKICDAVLIAHLFMHSLVSTSILPTNSIHRPTRRENHQLSHRQK